MLSVSFPSQFAILEFDPNDFQLQWLPNGSMLTGDSIGAGIEADFVISLQPPYRIYAATEFDSRAELDFFLQRHPQEMLDTLGTAGINGGPAACCLCIGSLNNQADGTPVSREEAHRAAEWYAGYLEAAAEAEGEDDEDDDEEAY